MAEVVNGRKLVPRDAFLTKSMPNSDWTRDEVEATVADYFVMLESELRGESYSKAEHNRRLQQIIGRS